MGIIEQVRQMDMEAGNAAGVRNLLFETDFDIYKIARLMEVSVDFVLEMKYKLSSETDNTL